VSLAFAAHASALSFAGYPALLARLDDDVAARIRRKAQTDLDRISSGGPIGSLFAVASRVPAGKSVTAI
jgi:hypothetical protein